MWPLNPWAKKVQNTWFLLHICFRQKRFYYMVRSWNYDGKPEFWVRHRRKFSLVTIDLPFTHTHTHTHTQDHKFCDANKTLNTCIKTRHIFEPFTIFFWYNFEHILNIFLNHSSYFAHIPFISLFFSKPTKIISYT